jgi:hypothetical protein
MIDFKGFYQVAKSVAQSVAKDTYKPSLNNKKSMELYQASVAKSDSSVTNKAKFCVDDSYTIEYNV